MSSSPEAGNWVARGS